MQTHVIFWMGVREFMKYLVKKSMPSSQRKLVYPSLPSSWNSPFMQSGSRPAHAQLNKNKLQMGKTVEKNPRKQPMQNQFLSGQGKGPNNSQNLKQNKDFKKFRPASPPGGVNKRYFQLFRKYEIHKGRHLYRIHDKGGNTPVYP